MKLLGKWTLLFALSFNTFAYTKGKTYKLTILHTNDHHGRFWPNAEGELGLAARSTLINSLRNQIKSEGGHVLLLDAGDVNTGIPQSDLQKAEPDFRGMSLLDYDVMAIGNHEFDQTLETIYQQQLWAGFPFISANIYYSKSGERPFPSHITKQLDDLKVTIFGLTTEDTPLKTNALHTKGLHFKAAVKEAKKLVPELRKNTDILIALTHIGHHPNESHKADAPGDVTLARKVNGIDLIVGGHTQKPLFKPDIQNGTIIVQAYEWGKYVGRVDLEFLDGKLKLKEYTLIPVNLKNTPKISPDKKLEAYLKPYKEKGDVLIRQMNKSQFSNTDLGMAEIEFIGDRAIVRNQETNLGNLVARAFKEKFNADIGLMNSGGIRESLEAGKITFESLLIVLPFKGEVVTAKLQGNALKKYLEQVVFELTAGSGSFPQMSGVEIVVNKKAKKFKKILINGKPLSERRMYTVAMPEFIAKGGDKYPPVKYEKSGNIDVNVLTEFLSKKKGLKARDFAPTGYIRYE
jgi:5'-nucleotidase/UDP-sugar diphosphatase